LRLKKLLCRGYISSLDSFILDIISSLAYYQQWKKIS
jgi:hypothetical protein